MKWSETTASQARYGDIAGKIWGDWDILWEDSEADYQGHAKFLAKKDGNYCYYEWWYGSCSGCDTWESAGLNDYDIETEMRREAMWFDEDLKFKNREHLTNWLRMLEEVKGGSSEMLVEALKNPTLVEALKLEIEDESGN